jgi:hypothetical protein
MNCDEFSEYVGSVIDHRLDETRLNEFNNHTLSCQSCKNIYELDLFTKEFIKTRLKRFTAPNYLSERIIDLIKKHETSGYPKTAKGSWLINFPRHIFVSMASIAAAILVFIIFSSKVPDVRSRAGGNDIISQAYSNYDAVLQGRIIPVFKTDDNHRLAEYFEKNFRCSVNVPVLKGCPLTGGTVTEDAGKKLASFFYQHGNCIIQVSQYKYDVAVQNQDIEIPLDAKKCLVNNTWYYANEQKNSFILWSRNKRLYIAAAQLEKNDLLEHLAGVE